VFISNVPVNRWKVQGVDILDVCYIPEEIDKGPAVTVLHGESVNPQDAQDISDQESAAYAAAASSGEPEENGVGGWFRK
jgi:hypothetical protein